MKTIIKIEIIVLVALLIVAVGVTLVTRDILMLKDPVLAQRTPEPIPQDAPVAVQAAARCSRAPSMW